MEGQQKINEIIDFIYENFNMLRRRILFGETIKFKTWLINHGMISTVSKIIIKLIFHDFIYFS